MEPPSATARVADGKCEAWAPVQSPGGTRDELAKKLGLKLEDVTVNVTLLGGGFGRKSKCDYVLEAALLSRAMGGAPVKVVWTREDDLHNDYLPHRLGRTHRCRDSTRRASVVAWRHRSVAPTIRRPLSRIPNASSRASSAMGVIDVPFAIPNLRCEIGEAEAHTRIGWFRSVSQHPARLRDAILCRRARRTRRGATPRTCCSS